ncbi:hypothetical protein KsCSTR_38320 [Candidatus Kuenenia stuttgartiensis]|jgi:hypothetical protein|uniref:Uncharacterized protein n=1 Tax=Kuenenia stuttgartiensis TaxID=174633 RepID=Q1Q5Y7_KUEST|nr:hypothetical protein KsCSTR_38320 [Candidatus Kuenenia stuttgartiensis]CAJ72991.1 unknown protein [Candidatus Kuenenia stuttgartiensis]
MVFFLSREFFKKLKCYKISNILLHRTFTVRLRHTVKASELVVVLRAPALKKPKL